jgi:hypothetical protein
LDNLTGETKMIPDVMIYTIFGCIFFGWLFFLILSFIEGMMQENKRILIIFNVLIILLGVVLLSIKWEYKEVGIFPVHTISQDNIEFRFIVYEIDGKKEVSFVDATEAVKVSEKYDIRGVVFPVSSLERFQYKAVSLSNKEN